MPSRRIRRERFFAASSSIRNGREPQSSSTVHAAPAFATHTFADRTTRRTAMSEDVLVEKRDDGIAKITLNRPDSLNAMGGQLMPMLAQALAEASTDRKVRCVVLTGAGRAFCAGGDVKGMAAGRDAIGDNGSSAGASSAAAGFQRGVEELRSSQRA